MPDFVLYYGIRPGNVSFLPGGVAPTVVWMQESHPLCAESSYVYCDLHSLRFYEGQRHTPFPLFHFDDRGTKIFTPGKQVTIGNQIPHAVRFSDETWRGPGNAAACSEVVIDSMGTTGVKMMTKQRTYTDTITVVWRDAVESAVTCGPMLPLAMIAPQEKRAVRLMQPLEKYQQYLNNRKGILRGTPIPDSNEGVARHCCRGSIGRL
jgi:hypothetical protein